ncbi:hypothetical protein [Bradyrhizobium sp. RT5a]|uniref:hypothetical protein n=1 Tax=Bradyrhizobium sp. RT5a TaxID=3156380 RepID=UPI003390A7BB
MSQKEDILEQIVEEYLIHRGYFVQRNIKYRPDKGDPGYVAQNDSVHSDIDVLAFNPCERGYRRVLVFTIKSYQDGFNFKTVVDKINSDGKINGRLAALSYRELCIPKWTEAFLKAVRSRTNETKFTYVLAVTWAKGDKERWTGNPRFRQAMKGNPLEVLTLKTMVDEIEPSLTKTPAATDIGRTLQLFRAAGLRPVSGAPQVSEL